MTEKRVRFRFAVVAAVLTLALIGLGVRLAFLHLGTQEATRASVQRSRRVERKILAGRGNLFDCEGRQNILALTLAVKDVCADPSVIVKSDHVLETSAKLADELDVPADVLAVKLSRPDLKFAYVKRFVREEELEGLWKAQLDGVFFRESTVRYYPHNSFMCHVLGFVNHEGTGSAGVEQRADRYLRGCSGLVESRVDAHQRELYCYEGRNIPAIKGADATLTVDQNIQFIVEQALDGVMAAHAARGAWAIVERVQTGEILAMASRPAYDPNEFRLAADDAKLNRAIGHVYEPGSTFKAITFAAAFNENVVTEDAVIDCERGAWFHSGRILHDSGNYDRLTVADGLKKSSNILTAKVALMLGEKRYYKYLTAFGVGRKTGIDLPGEESGILHPRSRWSKISLSRIAIGQGVAVTALQMLGAFCAIANDGFLMQPYLISQVNGSDGTVLLRRKPEMLSRPISYQTAARMRRLLGRVAEDGGTGRRARVEGYEVAGKTGTAQKPVPGGYSKTDYIASFVGFLPVAAPEIGIIVVVDTPHPRHTGGRVAAPAFGEIAEQTVRYLDIPPVRRGRLAQR